MKMDADQTVETLRSIGINAILLPGTFTHNETISILNADDDGEYVDRDEIYMRSVWNVRAGTSVASILIDLRKLAVARVQAA